MPKDLEIHGWRDTFTIETTYDTRGLHGPVAGKRKIPVSRY
ncbi:MAG: hypothetical protein ABFE13_19260 [Phycisphaerales bacterium]